MAAKDEKVLIKVENYGGSDSRKWEVTVGSELYGNRRWTGIPQRFRREERAYEVASYLATKYIEDGRVVIIISRSGKERTLGA